MMRKEQLFSSWELGHFVKTLKSVDDFRED